MDVSTFKHAYISRVQHLHAIQICRQGRRPSWIVGSHEMQGIRPRPWEKSFQGNSASSIVSYAVLEIDAGLFLVRFIGIRKLAAITSFNSSGGRIVTSHWLCDVAFGNCAHFTDSAETNFFVISWLLQSQSARSLFRERCFWCGLMILLTWHPHNWEIWIRILSTKPESLMAQGVI